MTAAVLPTSSAVLKRAAVEVKRRGWCQGQYRNDEGAVCVLGAIELAVVELFDNWNRRGALSAEVEARGRLRRHVFPPATGAGLDLIPTWNDKPGQTADQVIAALEAAAGLAYEPIAPVGRVAS